MHLAKALRRVCLSLLRRRHDPRTPMALAADWHLFGSAVHHRSATEDLSPRGAMLSSVKSSPIGSPLVVALTTARGPVELHARVAWSEPTRMGIRFTRPCSALF